MITLSIPIGRRCCAACVELVERRLRENPHVAGAHVNASNGVAQVEARPDQVSVEELSEQAGECCGGRCPAPVPDASVSSHHHAHTARLQDGADASEAQAAAHAAHAGMARAGHDMSDPRMAAAMEADMRRRFWISLVLALPVVAYSGLGTLVLGGRTLPTPFGVPADWIMLAFATSVALWTSSVFHVGALYALKSRVLNMSVLVSLGILTSYLFSVGVTLLAPGQETFYEAAVMLAVFLLFGHWMEMKARRGSSDSVRKLLDMAPQTATVEREGRQIEVPVADVMVGTVVVLKPGDKAPVDGEVIDGASSIDESVVTGESLPVDKGPGDLVIAGTINQAGSLRFRAIRVGADTALAHIVRMVETAQNSKAPAQRVADRAAHYLTLIAVGSGVLTFLIWLLVAREPLLMAFITQGKSVIVVAVDGQAAGIIAVTDVVRPNAARAIAELKQLGIEPVMMTGDTKRTADAVAKQVGIERVFAEVLPEAKAAGVKQLQSEGKFIAMVGDGVNDAPALAQADLGIAIGAGTDVAVETGDIVLIKSDPADVLAAIRLSRATVQKMKQNLFWAAIYNVIAIPVAAGVLYPSLGLVLRPEFGALAMSASSITVVSNALLLRRTA
jgi:cation transport ATPase